MVITEPATGATVSSPVKVCMDVHGVEVQPAKKGVNPGKGHHHLLIDADLPADLIKRIGKDANHVHMGDGSTCKTLNLSDGKHVAPFLLTVGTFLSVLSSRPQLLLQSIKNFCISASPFGKAGFFCA